MTRRERRSIYHRQAVADGVCTTCFARPVVDGKMTCQVCIERRRDVAEGGGPRARGIPRSFALSIRRNTRLSLREFPRHAYADELAAERPKTRADCASVPRPCPWIGCRHHLFLDVNPETGTITFVRPDVDPWDMPPDRSCALDVAESGGLTLEEVGDILNVTRERARQIETKGLFRLKRAQAIAALDPDNT